MILKMFTVYDSKIAAYLSPFYEQAIGQAVRAFEDTCKDPNHVFAKHPPDFTLFYIGEFDDQDCKINLLETPQSLCTALETISQKPELVEEGS